jgi:hypothetical protein
VAPIMKNHVTADPLEIRLLRAISHVGSTPFPRTVELRLKTPGHAGRLYAASAGCGTARGSRTDPLVPRRVFGIGDGALAPA